MGLARHTMTIVAGLLAPVFAVMMAAAIGGHVIQSRPSISFDKIRPDFSKLLLLPSLRRMFGLDGVTNLVKGLAKILLVGFAVWIQIWPERNMLESVMSQTPLGVVGDMAHLLFKVLIAALAALAAIAALDYFMQRYRFLQRNRMSKQEIKEEFRQNEGDPQIRRRSTRSVWNARRNA